MNISFGYICFFYIASIITYTTGQEFSVKRNNTNIERYTRIELSKLDEEHKITIAIKQQNIDLLREMLEERGKPGHSNYQKWLTYDEIGSLVENRNAKNNITDWLNKNDINIMSISPHGEYITVASSIQKLNSLLNMSMYKWRENLSGNFIHRAYNYSIPENLKEHISYIFNTVQFHPMIFKRPKQNLKFNSFVSFPDVNINGGVGKIKTKNMNIVKNINNVKNNLKKLFNSPKKSATTATTSATIKPKLKTSFQGTTISFLNKVYKIPSNIGNPNISQAVFETNNENFQQSDILKFQTKYGLTKQSASVYGTTPLTSGCNTNNCGEGSLDIQYIMGIAQKSQSIFWFEELGHGDPFFNFIVHAANMSNVPGTLSISWSAYEYQVDPSYLESFNIEAMKITAMGTTIFVSSGDDGVSGYNCLCNQNSSSFNYWWATNNWNGSGYFPQYPATSPYVVAVGATMGPEKGNPEIACQSQYGGVITTGGGFSTYFSRPDYQNKSVNNYFNNFKKSDASAPPAPAPGYNPYGRGYPDISFIGVYYVPYIGGTQYVLFGTSASAPVAAALFTLINSARKLKGLPNVGYIHPTIYANEKKFTDVISGTNNCCVKYSPTGEPKCCNSGFTCTVGWDPVVGLGSITYDNLLSIFYTNVSSVEPTYQPTSNPTTMYPTGEPTYIPTREPTTKPSKKPTTKKPTKKPTTKKPTISPTSMPTSEPTTVPTNEPTTHFPTSEPTYFPTCEPTTKKPTKQPSRRPSRRPTKRPSKKPTKKPTKVPTQDPISITVGYK